MAEKIVITGATGFIGRSLVASLLADGYEVVVVTRNAKNARWYFEDRVAISEWDGVTSKGWAHHVDGSLAVINLAGENVASGRWNRKKMKKILQSRLDSCRAVYEAVDSAYLKPEVVIQSSATGFYGATLSAERFDECSKAGDGFLSFIVQKWEEAALPMAELGPRLVILRTGIVLGTEEGMLAQTIVPFRYFFGGHTGSGDQYVSWIHIEDEIEAIKFIIRKKSLRGVFNLSSPEPVTARDFFRTLGRVISRPSWFHLPSFLIKAAFGEMGDEVLLKGQRVYPLRLQKSGYNFRFPVLKDALENLLIK